jgi:hypothetical protein
VRAPGLKEEIAAALGEIRERLDAVGATIQREHEHRGLRCESCEAWLAAVALDELARRVGNVAGRMRVRPVPLFLDAEP